MSPDTIVVGAGVVGCAIAYELARRGQRVVVLDRRAPGQGATQASGGILAPYIEGHSLELRDLTGEGLVRYEAFLHTLGVSRGAPVMYERTGSLQVATTDEQLDGMRETAAFLERLGVPCDTLDAADVHRAEPALASGIRGGLFIPIHGFIGPDPFVACLVATARSLGVDFRIGPRVTRIRALNGPDETARRSSQAVEVTTDVDTWSAASVVVAAGSWAGQLHIDGVPALPVQPVKGQLLHLRNEGPRLRAVVWGARAYLVPWPDGTLLVGGTVERAGFDESTTAAGVHEMLGAAIALVEASDRLRFLSGRAGLRPGSPDERPLVGPSMRAPGVFFAVGHYRNGVMLAPLTAEVTADFIVDRRRDPMLELTSPQRFGDL